MSHPYAHDPDCGYWYDHYEQECTCARPGWNPLATDPAQDLRAVLAELAELKRRIAELEARIASSG